MTELGSNDQTDLQCQAARHCHHQVQWATCAAWHWGSGPHSEGEKTPMVWTCGMLKWCSQDSLLHTGWWKAWALEAQDDMETADREGLQRVEALLSTLMIDIPGNLVWDLPCVQQASYLEGPHWCGCCPCTCTFIKNPIMMMIYWVHFISFWHRYHPMTQKWRVLLFHAFIMGTAFQIGQILWDFISQFCEILFHNVTYGMYVCTPQPLYNTIVGIHSINRVS